MNMRPNSELKIEAYQFRKESPKDDNAVFHLIKGAFRTVTGLIGKRGNPGAYKLRAAAATLGIRGTDFTTRICEDKECQEGSVTLRAKHEIPAPRVVGRVMLLQGELAAKDTSEKIRKMVLGSPVHEGDVLHSDQKSYAVIAFRDESRITLQEKSSFYVERFKYDKANPSQDGAVLRLLKGGVRVVTGLIGRVKHENYKFGVSGATIGIRGTGFDAWCYGACATGNGDPGATQDKPLDGGGVYVWSGAVVLTTPKGANDVSVQQAAIIARDTGKPEPVVNIPQAIIENDAPRPDSIPVDMNQEFNTESSTGEAGLYVKVNEGLVVLTNAGKSLNLGGGENGFANERDLTRLSNTPWFMNENPDNESLEKISPNPSINTDGCVVR
jgi:hypothetical protein